MAIILTIKPEHFERIKSGEKLCEFRKTYIRKWVGNDVYFCISGTKGKILGKCQFVDIIEFTEYFKESFYIFHNELHCKHGSNYYNLTIEEYLYLTQNNKKNHYGLCYKISNFEPCSLHISDFGLKRVPQSFQYMEDLK
jgi:predicted transcriptional regulator